MKLLTKTVVDLPSFDIILGDFSHMLLMLHAVFMVLFNNVAILDTIFLLLFSACYNRYEWIILLGVVYPSSNF